MYPEEIVIPMKEELTENGFSELLTAADVEKNGIELGDMQKKTIEKIEQLTLYIIDLQNQITELKAKVNDTEKEYNFIFDTGATTYISEKLIVSLNLKNGINLVSKDVNVVRVP